jgi:hypothetical protein
MGDWLIDWLIDIKMSITEVGLDLPGREYSPEDGYCVHGTVPLES